LCLEHASHDHPKCEHWLESQVSEEEAQSSKTGVRPRSLPWTGEPFLPVDIDIVSQRSTPLIIGMVGSADAGKTSYLGMLYTLLFNGFKFNRWSFSGSYTLAAWETLAQYLRIRSNGSVAFAPPTPSNPDYYSLYHLAMKKDGILRDVLFADSSGEVFKLWSENTEDQNAENARWIYEKSTGFIFMVDCKALIDRKGAAKNEIVQMAEQLAANLNGRPVAVVWSKSDEIDHIRGNIKESLTEDLFHLLGAAQVFEVSNFSKSDSDVLCHENNIAVTEYLLDELNKTKKIILELNSCESNNVFLNYAGASNCE